MLLEKVTFKQKLERQYISKNILPVRGQCKDKVLSWELGGFLMDKVANMP